MIIIKSVMDGTFAGVRYETWGGDFKMVWASTGKSEESVRNNLMGGMTEGGSSLAGLRKLKEIMDNLPTDSNYVTVSNSNALTRLLNWEQTSDDTFVLRRS